MKSKIFVSTNIEKRFLIGTHDGSFSTDEVVACAILAILYSEDFTVEIIRTKDVEKLKKADILINVPPQKNEQKSYKTAHLVWKDLGEEIISKSTKTYINEPKCIADDLDKNIFQTLEVNEKNPFSCISSFLPPWNSFNYEENFKHALHVASLLLEFTISQVTSRYHAKEDILYRISCYDIPHQEDLFFNGTLELANEKEPWLETVLEYNLKESEKTVDFVIFPTFHEEKDWTAKCVPVTLEENSKPRIPFPKTWIGIQDEKLTKVTGIEGAISCSEDGLSVRAKTKDDIRSLCLRASLSFLQNL